MRLAKHAPYATLSAPTTRVSWVECAHVPPCASSVATAQDTVDDVRDRAAERVGTVLSDRYRLEKLIAVGGMGSVYAATAPDGRRVAVKILHEGLTTDLEMAALFAREAIVARSVCCPYVVPVLESGVDERVGPFLVMPLLEGETARARSERDGGRLGTSEAVSLALDVLEALRSLHAAGWVHGDVKPENVFLSERGEVRLLDFGVARAIGEPDPERGESRRRAIGTPGFMAPEQALGQRHEMDARTDVWAVGALLFALVTGRAVHSADSADRIVARTAGRRAPRVASVSRDVSPALAAVIDRALAHEKLARWPDAETMAEALRLAVPEGARACVRLATSGSRSTSPKASASLATRTLACAPSPYRARRALIGVAALSLAACLAVGGARATHRRAGTRAAVALLEAPAAETRDAPLVRNDLRGKSSGVTRP